VVLEKKGTEFLDAVMLARMVFVETFPFIETRVFGTANLSFLVSNTCSICCSQVKSFRKLC
jgi:hypothetical protein